MLSSESYHMENIEDHNIIGLSNELNFSFEEIEYKTNYTWKFQKKGRLW